MTALTHDHVQRRQVAGTVDPDESPQRVSDRELGLAAVLVGLLVLLTTVLVPLVS